MLKTLTQHFTSNRSDAISLKTLDLPNGETIAYREVGNSTKVLVLLHGAFGSSAEFLNIMSQISDVVRVVAIDHRGHGHSSYKKPQKTLDDNVIDLKQFVDTLGLKKFYLLGWSMGGAIGMKFSGRHPEYVEGLILLNAVGAMGLPLYRMDESGNLTRERILTEEDAIKHPGAIIMATWIADKDYDNLEALRQLRVFNGKGKLNLQGLKQSIEGTLLCRCASRLGHLMNVYNISSEHNGVVEGTGEVSKIQCKVLIIHGDEDIVVPKKYAQLNKKLLGDKAELKIFTNSGHGSHEDYPEEFLALVKQFCEI